MSVQALSWVLDHSPAKGSDRLVMISLANHAGQLVTDNPTDPRPAFEAWPGVATIAREARLDRPRTVNDALARLVRDGAVVRIVNGAPDARIRGDRRPNLYRVLVENGVPCGVTRCGWCGMTPNAPRDDARRHDGVTLGDTTGCRETSPEPSLEPSDEPNPEPLALEAPPSGPTTGSIANGLVRIVWERKTPRPATPFVAAVKIAERLLVAGHEAQAIEEAMVQAPTLTTAAVEIALARRRPPQRGAGAPVRAPRDGQEGRVRL